MDELIKRGAVRLMLKGLANGVLSGEAKALKTNDIKSLYQIRGAKEILKTADDYLDDIPTVDAQPVNESHLIDWYISSVSEDDSPVWTEEHIAELCNDFYIIPKDIRGENNG